MIGKTWKSVHLIFHRLIQRDFCWCEFALSNSQSYDNHTPKRPLIKNKVCNYLTSKLNIPCLGMCESNHTPFMARSACACK